METRVEKRSKNALLRVPSPPAIVIRRMDILKIVLGAIATVIVFYATSSMLLAQKQLLAATRLSGYLTYWQNWILEYKMSSLYSLGAMWNQENEELRKGGGGVTELAKLEEERREKIAVIKEELERRTDLFDEAPLRKYLQRHSKESILEYARVASRNLIDGKTFVSDEEATVLGVAVTSKCIQLKMELTDLVDGVTGLVIVMVQNSDKRFEFKDYTQEISELIWRGISVSRHIDLISRAARTICSKSVLSLTVENMRTGRGLTKR